MLAFDYCVAWRGRFKGYLDGLEASLDRRDPAPVIIRDDQATRVGAVACHLLACVFFDATSYSRIRFVWKSIALSFALNSMHPTG